MATPNIDSNKSEEPEAEITEAANRTERRACSLREARRLSRMTQKQVALALGVTQGRISHLEAQSIDAMSVESLRRYAEALGGRLEITMKLPNGTVEPED